jgi:hypothetical protein
LCQLVHGTSRLMALNMRGFHILIQINGTQDSSKPEGNLSNTLLEEQHCAKKIASRLGRQLTMGVGFLEQYGLRMFPPNRPDQL